ncbi:platelet binding protein GspB [Astyanax mexicanus]|uniref:Si:ch211-214c7.4 n=1 Tax=Astyanax mexicanus TaxID=7994 RepID=A0A8B9LSX3_ASTMX|nr:platelet binding protein GspB [Astyanax mexicanus]
MKPDGVSTTPPEPTEALGASAVAEDVAGEEQPQEEQNQSPPQPEELENVQKVADSTAPPPEKEANGKTSGPKNGTKAPVKTKFGTTAPKTSSAVSRPAPAQSRVANGVSRPATNGAAKKPANAPVAAGVKKPTSTGAAAQVKKGPTAATAAPRTQTKVAERKPVGTARPAVASTSSGTKPVAANAATALNKRPAAAANNAAPKPKTTAPRPATAPASKPAVSAASKAAPVPKTRPTTAAASHTTTSTASVRPTTTTTKPSASRTASAPSTARSASLQSSKTTTTTVAAAKKDAGQTSTKAPVRKPMATKTTTSAPSASAKPSKSEPPKPATAAKRPPVDTKTTRPKTDDSKPVPTRKVPPSPRNKLASASNIKQAGSSTPVAVKRQATKPTQSVSPMVIKGKPSEKEQAKDPVEPSAAVATVSPTTDVPAAASIPGVDTNSALQVEEQLNQETSVPVEVQNNEVAQVPSSEPSDMENVPVMEPVNVESLAVELEAEAPIEESGPPSVPVEHESNDYILVETPALQEGTLQEPIPIPPLEVSVAAAVIPKTVEAVEKAEQILHNDAEEEEEEREGSQQVSISDMSGTQPTEESRPGSAGLAGSVWRAGGLLSELDSEDVSCSQQGASELSAPGVLEGTESMDDLGEASLKGADGEGASAGSPDFEKVPDIPVNEDANEDEEDDDDDRVCDMDVGSERAEDSHRQCHDNEDEEEDEDVEMASEGITESGLESYGNADEDDFAEDYRLDNLNRMQPHPIVPSAPPAAQWDQTNPFADPWVQPRQQDSTFPSSPSSSPRQANLETLAQASHQAWLDLEHAKGGPTSHVQPLIEPVPSSPQLAPVPSAEKDASFSTDLGSRTQGMSGPNAASGLEQDAHSCSDTSTPEEQKEYNIISGVDNLQQQVAAPASSVPAVLPDIMQDLGIQLEHGDEEEEPETLPADDILGGPATAPTSVPSSPSSATEDEASDTEGEMQISEPSMEPVATGNECFGSAQVAHSLSTLEEREEASAEAEGGGGGDTPQSATSAASYGFDCTTTSNSNAQSTTESCAKSPGIFSLENEDQLPDEAKDPLLIKELILTPACAPGDVDKLHAEQQEIAPPNLEQQYMHCVKANEELPGPCSPSGTEPTEGGLVNPSSQHQDGDWDLDAQHPYYSTICEKTDGSLAGINVHSLHQPHEVLTIHMTMSPKRRPRAPVDHVTNPPRLPTDLPPRIPSMGPNAQLQRLERHQQQLRQIEQRREQQNQWSESREQQREREQNGDDHKCDEDENEERARKQAEEKLEEKKKREVKEKELEDQRRDLLQLQIQQQQQELKQRQQIMQWQQELEQQNKISNQNKQSKTVTNVLLSPSGLCTIYEALETSDAEDDVKDENEENEMTEKKTGCEESRQLCSKPERDRSPSKDNTAFSQAQSTCSPELIQDQEVGLTDPAAPDSPLTCSEQLSPVELDWGKKVDIVQQLINQTLLLAGDSCSPLYLLPGGSAGTLSPLETSLWPNLLPSLAQPSATVTSVSSFSPEASGSSPQGEWTVVELETHH